MTKKIKSLPIGQTCHICGSKIYATLYNVDGERFVCETCDCVDSDGFPKMLFVYTLRQYSIELQQRTNYSNSLLLFLKNS